MSGVSTQVAQNIRRGAFGESPLTFVDKFGVYLSRRAVLRAVGKRDCLEMLDVGCGHHASLLRALWPRLNRGVGIDLRVSDDAKQTERLTFVEAPFESVMRGLPTGSFDVVAMLSVLEHLADPLAVLCEQRRVVRPGGFLLINVPTWLGKPFLEFSAFRLGLSPAEEMNDHKMYYDKRDLWPLLVKAGFRPSELSLKYHKFGLNLFATARA